MAQGLRRMLDMKTFSYLSIVLALVVLPLTTACWPCEGDIWHRYTQDVTSVTLADGTPVRVPLEIGASTVRSPDPLVVEIGMDDCGGGSFEVGVRMFDADGAELDGIGGFRNGTTGLLQLNCPMRGVQIEVPQEALACGTQRCGASLEVELTAMSSVGPREVQVRLVTSDCVDRPRNDGVIEAWGE